MLNSVNIIFGCYFMNVIGMSLPLESFGDPFGIPRMSVGESCRTSLGNPWGILQDFSKEFSQRFTLTSQIDLQESVRTCPGKSLKDFSKEIPQGLLR